jgi:hypothetical protein
MENFTSMREALDRDTDMNYVCSHQIFAGKRGKEKGLFLDTVMS